MLRWILAMATVAVSNIPVFSDASGHGNQGHLQAALTNGRWWIYYAASKTATTISTVVSSSNDLTSATWSAGAASPAFPSSHALTANDQRNLGCLGFTNGSTDVVHVSVCMVVASTSQHAEHIRATVTGPTTVTWDASWNETTPGTNGATDTIKGNSLGASSDGHIHEAMNSGMADLNDAQARLSTNADTGATWTNGFGAAANIESVSFTVNSYALISVGSAAMLCIYDDGGAAVPDCTGLHFNKYTSGTTWPTSGSGNTNVSSTQENKNDWVAVRVDDTHIWAFRRETTLGINYVRYSGTSWDISPSNLNGPSIKAGSGLFACVNGSDVYLFWIDSTGNGAIKYVKGTGANGISITWGSVQTLEAAAATARNYISGCPTVMNSQIGILCTRVNGSNFDLEVTALSLAGPPAAPSGWEESESSAWRRSLRENRQVIPLAA